MVADINHFPIVGAEIQRELYTLLALLFADEKMREIGEQNLQFASLSDSEMHLVLPLKFLTVAASIRSAIDASNSSNVGDSDNCGLHFRDAKTKDGKPLSLRKACNCAIHADRTLFYPENEPARDGVVIFNGKITLYGRHQNQNQKQRWKAVIDLEAFAVACLAVLQGAP